MSPPLRLKRSRSRSNVSPTLGQRLGGRVAAVIAVQLVDDVDQPGLVLGRAGEVAAVALDEIEHPLVRLVLDPLARDLDPAEHVACGAVRIDALGDRRVHAGVQLLLREDLQARLSLLQLGRIVELGKRPARRFRRRGFVAHAAAQRLVVAAVGVARFLGVGLPDLAAGQQLGDARCEAHSSPPFGLRQPRISAAAFCAWLISSRIEPRSLSPPSSSSR
jgi:hypothetical protein